MDVRALSWSLLVAGCTLVSPYDAPVSEDDREACRNGLDDDFDGTVDCDDEDCEGRCPEHAADTCTNTIDDDSDGLVDLEDARCWPYAAIAVRHCGSTAGSSLPPALADAWSLGTTALAADGALVLCDEASVRTRDPVTGGLEGTRFTATLRGGSDGVLSLTPADRVAPGIADPASTVELVLVGGAIELRSAGVDTRGSLGPGDPTAAIDVEIVIRAPRTAHASVRRGGGRALELSIEAPASWSDAEPLVLGLRAGIEGTRCLGVVRTDASRPDFDPCGREVPEIRDVVTGDARAVLDVGAFSCAIVVADHRCRVYRSSDGTVWSSVGELPMADECEDAALAWDPVREEVRAVAADLTSADVVVATSADCRSWLADPRLLLSGILTGDARLAGYAIVEEDGVVSHLLDVSLPRGVVSTLRSPTGEPGTFRADPPLPALPAAALTAEAGTVGRRIVRVGSDPVLLVPDAETDGFAAYTLGPGRGSALAWVEIGTPWLTPSDALGTFDGWRIPTATFSVRPGGIRVLHSGAGAFPCPGCLEPIGTTEMTLSLRCTGAGCGGPCESDGDCDDADPCTANDRCDREHRRCTWDLVDADGDGHAPIECGGDDCHDQNGSAFPGAFDSCDALDLDCDGRPGPAGPDVCGGGDWDCDGAVDEDGAVATDPEHCGTCGMSCAVTGAEVACDGGVCEFTCVPGALDLDGARNNGCEHVCLGRLPDERCDDRDEDCDGHVDEAESLVSDPEHCGGCDVRCRFRRGVAECAPGAVCRLAVCAPGFTNDDGDEANGCESPACVATEVCDGYDDDCDGRTDEDATDVGFPCGTDVGTCQAGVVVCEAGERTCSGDTPPGVEVCNGIDDDCNELVDDLATLGTRCGIELGACRAGTVACMEGVEECAGATFPSGEICNGIDDDCNGFVDDQGAFCPPQTLCVFGRCEQECSGGGGNPCPAGLTARLAGTRCYCS